MRIDDLQFEGLVLCQDEKGYPFTSDSVLLANYVKFMPGSKVVEFCSGSGVISVLLSKKQRPSVIYGFEIMKEPFDLFKKSVEMNKLENVVFPMNEKLEDSANILGVGFADVVVCNPPYLETRDEKIEKTIKNVATTEILTNLESVVESASKLLKYGGKFYMVHRADRLVDVLCTLRKFKLEPKKLNIIYPKENFEPVVFLVEAHSGGKKGLRISKATFSNEMNKA